MEELEIEEQSLEKGVVSLALRGSLDLHSTPKLSRVLDDLIARGKQRIIVDLTDISHVSSVGWGTLLKSGRELKKAGGEMKLVAMSERVRKIFELLELGHELESADSVESALASFPE